MAEEQTNTKSSTSLIKKRTTGLLMLLVLCVILYPVIFSSQKTVHQVDETSQIPVNSMVPLQPLNIQLNIRSNAVADSVQAANSKTSISQTNTPKIANSKIDNPIADKALNSSSLEVVASRTELASLGSSGRIKGQQSPESVDIDQAPSRRSDGLPSAWLIQVASLRRPDQAKKIEKILLGKGYKSYIEQEDLPEGTRFRVRVGPYVDSRACKADKKKIAKIINTQPVILNYEI